MCAVLTTAHIHNVTFVSLVPYMYAYISLRFNVTEYLSI